MTASNQEEVNKVYKHIFTKLWQESCGEYLNFGMFHDQCGSLTEANDYMVDWIIKTLKIDENSNVLDIGCGKGKYTVEIVRKTGCKFVGIDIVEEFIESGNKALAAENLTEQGVFLVGNMLQLPEAIGDQKFTHVLALGVLFYVHDKMSEFLIGLKPHMGEDATLLIHDFSRNVPLEEVKVVMNHWRTTGDTLETQDYLEIIKSSGYTVTYYSDDTHMGLKSCQWVVDTADRIAPPDMTEPRKVFTFWVLRDALKERRILHNTIIAKL